MLQQASFKLTFEVWIEFDALVESQKNTLKSFKNLFENQRHCDIQFYFENGERIGAHITILSARSPVLDVSTRHERVDYKKS